MDVISSEISGCLELPWVVAMAAGEDVRVGGASGKGNLVGLCKSVLCILMVVSLRGERGVW